jgi:hypothetical protein
MNTEYEELREEIVEPRRCRGSEKKDEFPSVTSSVSPCLYGYLTPA